MPDWGPFGLAGKSAIVTGSAKGIGFGIAQRLLEAGANVLLTDRDEVALTAAAEMLKHAHGRVATQSADVTHPAAGDIMVTACVTHFGRVDIMVNNAGIFPAKPMLEMTPEFWDRIMAVNLKGLAFTAKAGALEMVKQGHGGKIINMASIDAFYPSAIGLAAYDASKGGVVMLTKSLALEVAKHGICVNAIAPGNTLTEGTTKPVDGTGAAAENIRRIRAEAVQRIPLGRRGTPDDMGLAAVFLASSAADYITGQTIIIDGGRLMS